MALSQQILHLLESLGERGLDVEFAILAVEEFADGLTGSEREDFRENEDAGRALAKWIAEAKLSPAWTVRNEEIERLGRFIGGDRGLDAHFTIAGLGEVPHVVARWKDLQTAGVVLVPGERVSHYLRQATTCYLYGFFDAAAVLSRSLLEFVLVQAFAELGGNSPIQSDPGKGNHLATLIERASETPFGPNTRILPESLRAKAHRIRRVGNNSVHRVSCNQADALDVIRDAGDILRHIYGSRLTEEA